MHSNHTILINALSNNCLVHYGLSMLPGEALDVQVFQDDVGNITDICWKDHILTPRQPYWHEIRSLTGLQIYDDEFNSKPKKLKTSFESIQGMHQLAEKHCSGVQT